MTFRIDQVRYPPKFSRRTPARMVIDPVIAVSIHQARKPGPLFLIIVGPVGPFNLIAPNPLTNAQFARTLGRVMGRPSFVPVPGFALKLAFGQVTSVLLEGQRAVPKRLLDLDFNFRFPDAEAALKDLLR